MAKVVAAVASVVAVVAQIGAFVATALGHPEIGALLTTISKVAAAVAVVAGGIAALTAKKPPGPLSDPTRWKADPFAGIPYAMGRTLVAGNIVYRRVHGADNRYETFATILSGAGPVQSIDTSFANKTTVAYDGGGNATGVYRNQLYQRAQLGACPEASAMLSPIGSPPGWDASSKLSGYAATLLTMAYDGKSNPPFTSEISPAWILQGVKVYDPRADSTYPGGTGPCRAYDEATYVYSENMFLHALTWCLGRFQNSKRVIGLGAPIAQIDVASFVEAANIADAHGWKIGGVVYSRPDTPWNVLKSILQAGAATPVTIGGTISCLMEAPRVSLATIIDDDIVGESSLAATQPRRSRINGVVPRYRSEAHDWTIVAADLVQVPDYVTADGGERTKDTEFSLVQQVGQATQLAAYEIVNAREVGPGTFPLKPAWMNYRVGDCVTIATRELAALKVLILGRDIDPGTGTVTFTVRTETDAKHSFALGQEGTAPLTPTVVAYVPASNVPGSTAWTAVGATLTGTSASIPAITVTGASDSPVADTVIIEYRQVTVLQAEDGEPIFDEGGRPIISEVDPGPWISSASLAANATLAMVAPLQSNGAYQVGISYSSRGIIGDRLILGPVVAGSLSVARGALQITGLDPEFPVTSDDTHIYIVAFTGTVDANTTQFPEATISGLAASTKYSIFWRLSTRAYEAAVYPALAQKASSDLVFVENHSTLDMPGGVAPPVTIPPPGYGGTGPRELVSI